MKGETCKYPYKAEPPCDFIPRTHEGCDYDVPPMGIWFDCISIHAPMKGATIYDLLQAYCDAGFQSTHP